jgi:hypothetical protein
MTELLFENANTIYGVPLTGQELDEIAGGEGGGGRGDNGGRGGWGGRADAIGGAMISGAGIASLSGISPGKSIGIGMLSGLGAASSGASSGRVICTHFFRKGMIERDIWRADIEFTATRLSPKTVRGYQYWAIPYVRLMRRSNLAEKIMFPLAVWRAEELAYKMGIRKQGNWRGKLVRLIGESICYSVGLFVGEQNWQQLWVDDTSKAHLPE